MKHNPVAPSTSLIIKGVNYELLFDVQSLGLAEKLIKRPLLMGLRGDDFSAPTIELMHGMLYACTRINHPELKFDVVETLITAKNRNRVWTAVMAAYMAFFAEADPDDEVEKNPTQDQK
jgi:hypothetical protein